MSAIRAFKLPQQELASEKQGGTDLMVLLPTLALVGLGIAMVFSASIPLAALNKREHIYDYLWREIIFASIGGLGMYLASKISLKMLQQQAGTLLFSACLLLIAVLILGVRVNGAKSWFALPFGLRFQPSEFAKLALIIATARYFAKFPRGLSNWRRALPPFLTLAAVTGLIAIEPDMGTAAVTVLAMLIYFHIAGAKLSHIFAASGVGMALAAVMVLKHPYQIQRFIGFFNRTELPLKEGYQATQSLIALGSGGLTGQGYCGSVWKYFYLPAAITDSILSVIGEELGLLLTWTVVALFAILVWRGLQIAGRASDRFSGLVAAGVTCLLGVQAMLNIAVTTHTVPATGVPLPLVSYGGSSLVFTMIGMGLLLNVSRQQLPASEESAAA